MTYEIEIQNECEYGISVDRLRQAAETVLSRHAVDPATSMTIVIASNKAVANLNRQFRDVDAPTDVLSFPADAPPVDIPGEPPYLGDLVIAYPYALEQARREGHDPDDSFALLVVHGSLHLLGYDHDTPERRTQMWAAQEEALVALGISPEIVPQFEGSAHD